MATVSIIIPAYNYGRYVAEAIDSALTQTFPDIEVIVVDDGSTDNTKEVCERYGTKIRYYYKNNAGLSAARNTGIELALGEFLVFLDADDMLLPSMVESCMNQFTVGTKELGVVGGGKILVDSTGGVLSKTDIGSKDESKLITTKDFIRANRFAVDACLVKCAVLESCGTFDEGLTSSEDRDMWIRISTRFLIRKVGADLVKVRAHDGSMSCNANRMYRNMTKVLDKARSSKHGQSLGLLFWQSVYAYRDFQVAWIYKSGGHIWDALFLLFRSLLRYPLSLGHEDLGQPVFFRIRALRSFVWDFLTGGRV